MTVGTFMLWMLGLVLLGAVGAWARRADPPLRHHTAVDWAVWLSTVQPCSGPRWAWLLPQHEVEDNEGRLYYYRRWKGTRFGLHDRGLRVIRSRAEYYALFNKEEQS